MFTADHTLDPYNGNHRNLYCYSKKECVWLAETICPLHVYKFQSQQHRQAQSFQGVAEQAEGRPKWTNKTRMSLVHSSQGSLCTRQIFMPADGITHLRLEVEGSTCITEPIKL